MSHRKRREVPTSKPRPPTFGEKLARTGRSFIRENLRLMLIFIGFTLLAQAFLPWTNNRSEFVWPTIVGGILLGLALPPRLWRTGRKDE